MEELGLKDALTIYQKQVELVDRIWWYFVTISLAVVGFTIGSDKATPTGLWFLFGSYALFTLGSGMSLNRGQQQLSHLKEQVKGVKVVALSRREALSCLAVAAAIVLAVIGVPLVWDLEL